MRLILSLFPIFLGLSACTAAQQSNAEACAADLLAAGTIDPTALLAITASDANCIDLAQSVIQSLITQTVLAQKARGLTH